jgi:succinylarginine dihydrolase
VHEALPSHQDFSDEGAANHMRLSAAPTSPGVEIFIYGRIGEAGGKAQASFPARQTLEACQAVARRHGLDPKRTIYGLQAQEAIDAGAFHNDVVAVAHDNVLFHHEQAFADKAKLYADIRAAAAGLFEPVFVEVPASELSLADAVSSYLFNSQLVRRPGALTLTLVAPVEVRENNRAGAAVAEMIARSGAPIGQVDYVDVRESMRNGGGPACLRLRIAMTEAERKAAAGGFFLDEALALKLESWIETHYRSELAPQDLPDPALITETQAALDALTQVLPLGSDFYPFQRA